MIGKTLNHYEILDILGKGGMGEVYRARDSKLGREVAIKVLPDILARDPERLARFSREAKLLASFSHQNIAGIHELGEDGDTRFLVMELVEGQDLDQLLSAGPVPMEDILHLFGQIAEALDYAHEQGIVHRDLKPANIKVTGDGKAKILDFGLGKAIEAGVVTTGAGDRTIDLESSSSRSLETQEGRILGTPAYMAPEQARGQVVDKRADIWAFGCCLYEALSGKPPFQGDTVMDLLADIVKTEPDWDSLRKDTPARVRVLLWRCLQKDPKRRLRDIGEARLELSGDWTDPSGVLPALGATVAPGMDRRKVILTSIAALVLGGLVAGLGTWSILRDRGSALVSSPVTRFEIDIGKTKPLFMQGVSADIALSTDGRRLAYTANVDGVRRLYLRDLDRIGSQVLPETDNAWRPFFSPDGEWIGFFVPGSPQSRTGKLMKVAVEGGNPQEICDAFPPGGATWLEDGTIVFTGQDDDLEITVSPFLSHLFRVNANGGSPVRLTRADGRKTGEWSHGLPRSAPGENFITFTITDAYGQGSAAVCNLETGEYWKILENALGAEYVPPGHIVFARNGGVWAAPFDPGSRTLGDPVLVQPDVEMSTEFLTAPFAVSGQGSFVYVPVAQTAEPLRTLVWVDHDGREETISVSPGKYWWPRVSPDGTRVAMSNQAGSGSGNEDIWIHQFDRAQSMVRFTFESARDANPLWSPDGRTIYFASYAAGVGNLFRRRADGTAPAESLWSSPGTDYPAGITPDGTRLLVGSNMDGKSWNFLELDLSNPGREPRALLDSPFNEGGASLSPDGKWLAYNTDETTPTQVFVRPYPDVNSGRWQISTDGGINPSWSRDGKEIYYRNGPRMMAVSVETTPMFRPGRPSVLFEGDYFYAPDLSVQYDLEYPGRRRFLMIKSLSDTRTTKVEYVGNWVSELPELTSPH